MHAKIECVLPGVLLLGFSIVCSATYRQSDDYWDEVKKASGSCSHDSQVDGIDGIVAQCAQQIQSMIEQIYYNDDDDDDDGYKRDYDDGENDHDKKYDDDGDDDDWDDDDDDWDDDDDNDYGDDDDYEDDFRHMHLTNEEQEIVDTAITECAFMAMGLMDDNQQVNIDSVNDYIYNNYLDDPDYGNVVRRGSDDCAGQYDPVSNGHGYCSCLRTNNVPIYKGVSWNSDSWNSK